MRALRSPPHPQGFLPRLARRRLHGALAFALLVLSTAVGILALVVLVLDVLADGLPWLDLQFLTSYPSRHPELAGLRAALWGTVWVGGLTGLFAFPIGVATAIHLEEYAPRHWLSRIIELNINNLAGVPSIVYGLLGLAIFSSALHLGRSILAGALTLTLLTLPVVIVASREAIRSVPESYRLASYALGATRWQTVRQIVLPSALPGILTGIILAMSRAIGEAAPMIAIAALVYVTFTPTTPFDRFTVLPIQIYNWISRPQPEWKELAATGIIVLLAVLLAMNATAILLRNRFQRRAQE